MALDLKTRIDVYEGAMWPVSNVKEDVVDLRESGPFIVRKWDGFVGTWTDETGPVSAEEALTAWEARTESGTKNLSFRHDDEYFRIFKADRIMKWSEGREMYSR